MPKYIPTYDDMYETKPCFICGRNVLDENRDTCSDFCKMQKVMFEEDWERFFWKDYQDLGDIENA